MGRYLCYYVAAAFSICSIITGPPIINPDDPLELPGNVEFERIPVQVPFGYNGEEVSLQAELFAPVNQSPEAFVLFMPGFGASYTSYKDYLKHFASHGFLVVGLDFYGACFSVEAEHDIKASQALETITYVQTTYPQYNALKVYTAGHSLGGKIAFYAASLSSSTTTITISGVMAMDPVNAGGPPCFICPDKCIQYPVAPNRKTGQEGVLQQMSSSNTSSLIIRSEPDPLTNPDEQFNAENFFFGLDGTTGSFAAPSPVWYYDFGHFPHALYVPVLPTKQTQIVKRTLLAFLLQEVLGTNVDAYLTGDIIQTDIQKDRLVSVQTR